MSHKLNHNWEFLNISYLKKVKNNLPETNKVNPAISVSRRNGGKIMTSLCSNVFKGFVTKLWCENFDVIITRKEIFYRK